MKFVKIFIVFLVYLYGCSSGYRYTSFKYPEPVNTVSKKIEYQPKKLFSLDGIFFDNRFDGARVNMAKKLNDSVIEIIIKPENTPVNNSPWYAFKIWSKSSKKQYVRLVYKNGFHRYRPKISKEGRNWVGLDSSAFSVSNDKKSILMKLTLDSLPLWIAAQPLINTRDVAQWIDSLQKSNNYCSGYESAGKSVLQRDIPFFKIGTNAGSGKKVILLFSRQHPPETTGFLALKFFIDALTREDQLSEKFFEQYEFWVFPLINPDGVDLGHWRHNANGVDLNRDWAYFRQPETRSIRDFILNKANSQRQKIVLGIDFHSTFKDIYYVNEATDYDFLKDFPRYWTNSIDRLVNSLSTYYDPTPIKKPVSKAWFYYQFGAVGITYEIGDDTPLQTIKQKSEAAAVSLMDLLIR